MKSAAWALALAAGLAGAIAVALIAPRPAGAPAGDTSDVHPLWAEVTWPFPMDQWGTGRAFACKAADCGAEVKLYLRAKLGSCNCTTGVADDGDLDRMSDFDLVGGEVSPLGAGRPITIAWMKGRSRAYALAARNSAGKSAISVPASKMRERVLEVLQREGYIRGFSVLERKSVGAELTVDELTEAIDASYDMVVAKLPKRERPAA